MKQIETQKHNIPLCVGFSVAGEHQPLFSELAEKYSKEIGEVYFSFTGISGGRSALGNENGYTDYGITEFLISELRKISRMGIKLNLLFNAACDGEDAFSKAHERKIISVLAYLEEKGCRPQIITTASPVTAQIARRFDKNIDVRASVNMRIATIKGAQYVEHLFDSFYICRDINREPRAFKTLSEYLRSKGKGMYMLANSGCLRNCSMQTFHDNAVAHEKEIMTKDNLTWAPQSGCREFLSKKENQAAFLQNTWVRPEDLKNYLGMVDGVKLATRMHENPSIVIDAYARGYYMGNLADLFEPGHGALFAPYVVDNKRFPEDWFEKTTLCSKECTTCGYCESVWKRVCVIS